MDQNSSATLEAFERVGRAVSDCTRLRILKILEPGELCVCQVTAIVGLAAPTVSKHLGLLRMAGLVAQRREGRWIYYRLASRSSNAYAEPVLKLLASGLGEDPVIMEDRERLNQLMTMPLDEVIAKGRYVFAAQRVAS